jgi:Uma2 family endonuclease
MNVAVSQPVQTLDDLMRHDGKAELIHGRIVPIMPTGFWPGKVARRITRSLEDYIAAGGVKGEVIEDNVGYGFDSPLPSGRESLSPDSSFFVGPLPPKHMRYVDGSPAFAVEVRSENDYGPAGDHAYEIKRDDYFSVGTLVVWDVDPKAETVTSYKISDPTAPIAFRRGDTADAEPAVPGWRLKIDDLFC